MKESKHKWIRIAKGRCCDLWYIHWQITIQWLNNKTSSHVQCTLCMRMSSLHYQQQVWEAQLSAMASYQFIPKLMGIITAKTKQDQVAICQLTSKVEPRGKWQIIQAACFWFQTLHSLQTNLRPMRCFCILAIRHTVENMVVCHYFLGKHCINIAWQWTTIPYEGTTSFFPRNLIWFPKSRLSQPRP